MLIKKFSYEAGPKYLSARTEQFFSFVIPAVAIVPLVIWQINRGEFSGLVNTIAFVTFIVYAVCFLIIDEAYIRREKFHRRARLAFLAQAFANEERIALSEFETRRVMHVINGNGYPIGESVEITVFNNERISVSVEDEYLRVRLTGLDQFLSSAERSSFDF